MSTPLSDLPRPPAGVWEISSTSSLQEAMDRLSGWGILAAPVRNAAAAPDAGWTEKYSGVCVRRESPQTRRSP